MKKILLFFLISIFTISGNAQELLNAPFNVTLPATYQVVDSILTSQGFKKTKNERLTYLPGLIAFVINYEGENERIILHATPESKTVYRLSIMHQNKNLEKGEIFENALAKVKAEYGKPRTYKVDEGSFYSSYSAEWWVDDGYIEITGWLDTYCASKEYCKKEQPDGIPLDEDGNRMKMVRY